MNSGSVQIDRLIEEAKIRLAAMSPAEQAAMWKAQRESFARGNVWGDEGTRRFAPRIIMPPWQPIASAPKNKDTFIIVAAPSGYSTTPLRAAVCRYYSEYRPRDPWQTHSNDSFSDGGEDPTLWLPLPREVS